MRVIVSRGDALLGGAALLGDLVNTLVGSRLTSKRTRRALLRRWGARLGAHVSIEHGCSFSSPDVVIGDRSYLNHGVKIDSPCTIGSHCAIGMEVLIIATDHAMGHGSGRAGAMSIQPVRVGNGCWVGARAIILPGVTIGDSCVISAGAVVRSDCQPHSLYAGIPAVLKRRLASENVAAT